METGVDMQAMPNSDVNKKPSSDSSSSQNACHFLGWPKVDQEMLTRIPVFREKGNSESPRKILPPRPPPVRLIDHLNYLNFA